MKVNIETLDDLAASGRVAQAIKKLGIKKVDEMIRNYPKLEHRVGELEVKVEEMCSELSRVNDNFERICDLLLEKNGGSDTQKSIYHKGDDNSRGKLINIDSKREGASTLYPYVSVGSR
ncbi:hypothetical protein [Helicobacter pylori]|uniref:hypothetical protein n=1 Tax=Helicobacter pylori TaxID=210 RepID=UPI000958AA72|nr:hypothetical protein [Helicobacter pylori]WRC26228.1 hypothetical protein KVE60_06740 [Helicobacter pylori]WRC28952.1 hypothetical protein KVB99_06755 [Helicobacter pylori]WRF39740.1 hypothetical protein E5E53_06725 [Helicobacter pylori]BAW61665.1 uncharacterized protein HPF70_1399 [Helicobacter pylori]BAW71050.1 uncharacterized protein HPMKF10_1370 [Helicobacter pylori]